MNSIGHQLADFEAGSKLVFELLDRLPAELREKATPLANVILGEHADLLPANIRALIGDSAARYEPHSAEAAKTPVAKIAEPEPVKAPRAAVPASPAPAALTPPADAIQVPLPAVLTRGHKAAEKALGMSPAPPPPPMSSGLAEGLAIVRAQRSGDSTPPKTCAWIPVRGAAKGKLCGKAATNTKKVTEFECYRCTAHGKPANATSELQTHLEKADLADTEAAGSPEPGSELGDEPGVPELGTPEDEPSAPAGPVPLECWSEVSGLREVGETASGMRIALLAEEIILVSLPEDACKKMKITSEPRYAAAGVLKSKEDAPAEWLDAEAAEELLLSLDELTEEVDLSPVFDYDIGVTYCMNGDLTELIMVETS